MMKLKSKKNKKSILIFFKNIFSGQIIILLVALALAIFTFFPFLKTIKQRQMVMNEINNLKNDIQKGEGLNSELKQAIQYFNSDEFLKEEARLKLGLKMPGEEVAIISGIGAQNNTELIPVEDEKFANLKKWLKYFFKS